jgi:hypothetical protein
MTATESSGYEIGQGGSLKSGPMPKTIVQEVLTKESTHGKHAY